MATCRVGRSSVADTYLYSMASAVRVLSSGVSALPSASVGLVDFAASSSALAATVSAHLERGTTSSTNRHSTAFLPPMPSAFVEK
jgi:hypothetical protein